MWITKKKNKLPMFSFLISLSLILVFQVSAQDFKNAITSIGCKQIAASDLKPMSISQSEFDKWEKDSYQLISKQSLIAKCRAQNGLFYKVLFEEEIFSTETAATARLSNLRKLPPNENSKSDLATSILLSEGFKVKNKIYTVGTFTYGVYLEGNVKIWCKKLQNKF